MPLDPLAEPLLRFSEEVEDAIAERRPIVALESTLLAHGLPEAERKETAAQLEGIVRAEGAVPATIAIIDKRFCVGLGAEDLARVVTGAEKASLRDLAPALAFGGVWATTVASTMAIAARAGLRVFATGGIGGVHRGASESFDESADLLALARFPLVVVCAGAKAILDLPATLERLESLGVPVVGYRTSELPAFYHGASGLPLHTRVETPDGVAELMTARFDRLGEAGLLVVQPPPASVAQEPARIESLIGGALEGARQAGVRGRALTPFLLEVLDRVSGGDVVKTNVALVAENVRLASNIAIADARRMDG